MAEATLEGLASISIQAIVKFVQERHPLDSETNGLLESIQLERELLEPMKGDCDLVIDTTELNVHQLKTKLIGAFEVSALSVCKSQ